MIELLVTECSLLLPPDTLSTSSPDFTPHRSAAYYLNMYLVLASDPDGSKRWLNVSSHHCLQECNFTYNTYNRCFGHKKKEKALTTKVYRKLIPYLFLPHFF
jgi:hypothetical protein